MENNNYLKSIKAKLYGKLDKTIKQEDEQIKGLVSAIIETIEEVKQLDYISYKDAEIVMREFNQILEPTYGDSIWFEYYDTKIDISIKEELVTFKHKNEKIFSISLNKDILNQIDSDYEHLLYILFSNMKSVSKTRYNDFRKLTMNNKQHIKRVIKEVLNRSSDEIKKDIDNIVKNIKLQNRENIINLIKDIVSKSKVKNINNNSNVHLESKSIIVEVNRDCNLITISKTNYKNDEKDKLIKIWIKENDIEITYEDKNKVNIDIELDKNRDTIINLLKIALY